MPADGDAVAHWAAAHAATVPRDSAAASLPAPALPSAPFPTVLASFRQIQTLDFNGGVSAVAWAHHVDGRLLVAVGVGPIVEIRDVYSGQTVRTLAAHAQIVSSVAWAQWPDGRLLLATGCFDGTARIWDPDSGEILHDLAAHDGQCNSVTWTRRRDRRLLLATAGWDSNVRIWDPVTGQAMTTLQAPGTTFALAWTRLPDGRSLLAAVGAVGSIRIWDTDTGQQIRLADDPYHRGRSGALWAAAWGHRADGQPVLVTTSNDAIRVWVEVDGEFAAEVLHAPGSMYGVSWAPFTDGRMLLAEWDGSSLSLWDGVTRQRIHGEELSSSAWGRAMADWRITLSGQLLLAVGTRDEQVHVWEAALDPPVRPPAAPAGSPLPGRRSARPTKILRQPEDVTPAFQADGNRSGAVRVSCVLDPSGQLLAATTQQDTADVRVWDVHTGRRLSILTGHSGEVRALAWGNRPDGQVVLATAGGSGVRIFDPYTGQTVRSFSEPDMKVFSLGWGYRPDGEPLVATANYPGDGTVRIWDPLAGQPMHTLAGRGANVDYMIFGELASERLVWTSIDTEWVRIWDARTWELIRSISTGGTAWSAAWGQQDGRPLLAIGDYRGTILITDPETGETLRTIAAGHPVSSLAWERRPGGPPVVVSGHRGMARIWDLETAAEVASVPSPNEARQTIDLVRDAAGDLLLVVANDSGERPVRVWRIATGLVDDTDAGPGDSGWSFARRTGELAGWVLRLGDAGLWLPPGPLADLVWLTGPDSLGTPGQPGTLADERLEALADEPGIKRLRDLAAREPAWEPEARVSFAALLAARLTIPGQYLPPADATPGTLRQALRHAMAGTPAPTGRDQGWPATPAVPTAPSAPAAPWQVPVADLRAAAAAITDQTVTLLQILGPAACTADPLLPARLAHRIPQLPALPLRQLRLLADSGARRPASGRRTAAGTVAYSPGTAGLARTGPVTRLLPTQLALPRDLMTIRRAENQLLYRQHRAPAPSAPEPVTIILDTTPPTIGPAGNALRLAAHMITTTLWEHGRYPSLITLTDPEIIAELRGPADLIHIWTGVTLNRALPALTAARRAAATIGQPVLFCAHHYTERGTYLPGPATRLLTAHHTAEPPPQVPASVWHAHLPPNPNHAQLDKTLGQLLTPDAGAQ